jgi:hypothetical protein
MWSVLQHGDLLHKALFYLDYPDPPLRLEGDLMVYRGERIRLSKQQRIFIELLLENTGKWVTHEQFRQRGISNPVKIMCALHVKALAEDISLPILPKNGAYQLTDVD